MCRLGDRVIQSQNNYEREVFNGDVGYVVKVDPLGKNMVVEFPETDYQKVQGGAASKSSPDPVPLGAHE